MPNYSFVVDSSFKPFSMQEMLVPFTAYKEAFERGEEAYQDLSDRSDKFKYLSETLPEGSKARQVYEGYANDLKAQAEDLARNGLNMGNRRALMSLKRRYQGEIGRLVEADAALRKEKELRRQLGTKDTSMLYATDNIGIDDFMDGATPNLYNISGTELYSRGAAAGRSASSRVYHASDGGDTLGGYYRKWVESHGYSKESVDAFRANATAIPELQQAADAILAERGVNENLTGASLDRARQSVLNGIIDGAVYQESVKPMRDEGVMSAAQKAADVRAGESLQLQKDEFAMKKQDWEDRRKLMYTFDDKGNITGLNPDYINPNQYELDPTTGKPRRKSSAQTAEEKAAAKEESSKGAALMKLGKGDLGHNEGFDVTFGSNRHHYNYIGALSSHRGQWYHGALGEDNPGHVGWGMFSSSNVENAWGNLSAEGSDSKDMRVLSPDEFSKLIQDDPAILKAIEERLEATGQNGDVDIQLIEVPNEKDSNKKGYLIAVH